MQCVNEVRLGAYLRIHWSLTGYMSSIDDLLKISTISLLLLMRFLSKDYLDVNGYIQSCESESKFKFEFVLRKLSLPVHSSKMMDEYVNVLGVLVCNVTT